jgi:hypothetical protein
VSVTGAGGADRACRKEVSSEGRELHGQVERKVQEAREDVEDERVEDDDGGVEMVDAPAIGVELPEALLLEDAGEPREGIDIVRAVPEAREEKAKAEACGEVREEPAGRHVRRR